ncbi:MAG: glutamine synthetase family protein [Anaerolineae bacterium]|nr:glutamine synthetase family protein [Anaerolineae bacterium]NUQ02917.1 glutamine synthetase [Anaerolineae bacterium]
MATLQGMLTIDDLAGRVERGEIDTVVLGFTDHYGRLMGKRIDAEFFLDSAAEAGTHACNYLLTVNMEMEPVRGYEYANWERGYGDFHMVPDLDTLRLASWLDKTAMVLCDVQEEKTHRLTPVAPRSILRRQLDRATGGGYQVMAASEIEYYVYEDSYKAAAQKDYTHLDPLGWYIEDYHMLQGTRQEKFTAHARNHLKRSGVPVETSKGEWGHGQHELNVRYADALSMADRHVVFKQCLKEIADRLGMSISFMAKPTPDATAGSSAHIHLSLWNADGSAFIGDSQIGPVRGSDAFRWFLGGWMAHVQEVMVFYAPTINSYKRYVDFSWAPTRIAWSYDNRTAGFRIVGTGNSLRIECRIPGADCNPYLAYAAALASGLDGIANHIEPPAIFEGDIYSAQTLPRVPYTLEHAVNHFANSSFTKQVFGVDVVEHYTHFFRTEIDSFNRWVTDWERRRYFEQI